MLVRAINYYVPRGHRYQRNKVFVFGKKKARYYYGDRETYRDEYLHSEHWKQLRERKLKETPLCETCGSGYKVEPHHLNYKNLYDVERCDLKSLCRRCHHNIHENHRIQQLITSKEKNKKHQRRLKNKISSRILRKRRSIIYSNSEESVSEKQQIYKELCRNERARNNLWTRCYRRPASAF